MAEKSFKKLAIYGLIIFLLLFGFINIATSGGPLFLKLELAGIAGVLLLSVLGLVYYKGWGERVLLFVFMMCLANLVLIWYFFGILYLVLTVLSLLGFILSIPEGKCLEPCCSGVPKPPKEKSSHSVRDVLNRTEEKKTEAKKEVPETKKSEAKKPEVKFTPGKYVASRRSNIYHEPKCDWAKKINSHRRVWFASREEAQNKGYRKHECVK